MGVPFTCNDSGITSGQSIEYQQVYSAAAFGGNPVTIIGLQFSDAFTKASSIKAGPVLAGNYAVTFSVTSKAVNGLSINLTSNIGSGQAVFFNGSLSGNFTSMSGLVFTGTPYLYNPAQGNLLMDVVATNQPSILSFGGNAGFLDTDQRGIVTSRAYNIKGGGNNTDVTGFVTTFEVTPEPSAAALLGAGLLLILAFKRKLTSPGGLD